MVMCILEGADKQWNSGNILWKGAPDQKMLICVTFKDVKDELKSE